MASDHLQTADLRLFLDRIRAGDREARNDLLRACQGRLEHLIRKMLRGHASVARWADTGDVFTNAALRLLRALEGTDVADTREFFNLAAKVIRRELLDLARHFYGPRGVGASRGPESDAPAPDPADSGPGPGELDRWAALHEAAEKLPADEREVFGLTLYHGWAQQQIAELLGVDERTVRRKLRSAAEKLHAALGGALPDIGGEGS